MSNPTWANMPFKVEHIYHIFFWEDRWSLVMYSARYFYETCNLILANQAQIILQHINQTIRIVKKI